MLCMYIYVVYCCIGQVKFQINDLKGTKTQVMVNFCKREIAELLISEPKCVLYEHFKNPVEKRSVKPFFWKNK